jgi:DNA-binding PadR family transcriptional regulator
MSDLTKIEEILLLAIWRLKSDAYGVKIRKYVSNVIKKDFSYGNLYSALGQLTRKKYVQKTMGVPTPNRRGRSKIYYTVTPLGFEALKNAHEMNEVLWAGINNVAFE